MLRHGKRPTTGKVQFDAILPSVPELLLKEAGASGHGSAPGLFSPASDACIAT